MDGAVLQHGKGCARRYPVTPVTKPRQTKSDKWKQRPCVLQYRAFADEVRYRRLRVANGDHVTFVLPMPMSWSGKRRAEFVGKPHKQTPDVDNLAKALLDALFGNDSHIWDIRLTKVWGVSGAIIVERI